MIDAMLDTLTTVRCSFCDEQLDAIAFLPHVRSEHPALLRAALIDRGISAEQHEALLDDLWRKFAEPLREASESDEP